MKTNKTVQNLGKDFCKMASIPKLMAVFRSGNVCRFFLIYPTYHSGHMDYPPVFCSSSKK
jgi:hypothetical protein